MGTSVELVEMHEVELLDRCLRGGRQAFGELVGRYQLLACSLAYSICGDLARSEDVAQEAFVQAWKQLGALQDRTKFKSWLCGIVRHLALAAHRRERRGEPIEAAAEQPSHQPTPPEAAISAEEKAIVWRALESLPETYREPLILFYRDEQSVERVARALELSEDAVKQRLARGRAMLREQVASVVEGVLKRSRPTAAFTAAVLAMLPVVMPSSVAAAVAAKAGKGSAAVKSAISSAILGAALGALAMLFVAWFASRKAGETAKYPRERQFVIRSVFVLTLMWLVMVLGFGRSVGLSRHEWFEDHPREFAILGMVWSLIVIATIVGLDLYQCRRRHQIRAEEEAAGTPPAALPQWVLRKYPELVMNLEYRSRRMLLGWPLLHIKYTLDQRSGPARGWVAFGGRAYGLLAAVGAQPVGLIAVGALPVGLIAFGGLSVGVLSLGGLGLGVWAMGGIAIGWQAVGGTAWAWNAALGGGAVARDFAVGIAAVAPHANDAAAHAALRQSLFLCAAEWLEAHPVTQILTFLMPLAVFLALMDWSRRRALRESARQ